MVRRTSVAPSFAAREPGATLRREVAGVRAAASPEDAQRIADCAVQSARFVGVERVSNARRIDAGSPQGLVTEQVAESRDA